MSGRKKVHTKEAEAASAAPDALPSAIALDEHGQPLEFEDSSDFETDSSMESIHEGDEDDEEGGDAMETIKQDDAAAAASAPDANKPVRQPNRSVFIDRRAI